MNGKKTHQVLTPVLLLLLSACVSEERGDQLGSLAGSSASWECDSEVLECMNQITYSNKRDDASINIGNVDMSDEIDEAGMNIGCNDIDDTRTVSLEGLLSEMVDLAHLTRLPMLNYTTHLATSHDKRSDTAMRGDSDWFANQDWIQLSPDEPSILLDVEGPGVIERIWSATPLGVLRIYVDSKNDPVIEEEMKDLLSGELPPFEYPFSFIAASGHNLYFPIPFLDGCRVTLTSEESGRVYYHVTYRLYEEGTIVESISTDVLTRTECIRALVDKRLSSIEPETGATDSGKLVKYSLSTNEPNSSAAVIEAGPKGGIIWELRIRPQRTEPEILRETILSLSFDHSETVRVPLGDFFAVGTKLIEINSLPVGVTADGVMVSRWAMPFQKEAKIALENAGSENNEAILEIVHDEYQWTDRSLYFYSRWRAPETFPTQPLHDWNLANIEGNGFYVGNVLNIFNSATNWWGEGDEKIFVDSEDFPSYFGTGTEDYYGYAWCSNETYSSAYIGQPVSSTRRNFGYSSLYRFHILDPIRFTSNIRFDFEVQHWGDSVDMIYDAVSFWYSRPGSIAKNVATESGLFRLPLPTIGEPTDVLEGPYRCGGS